MAPKSLLFAILVLLFSGVYSWAQFTNGGIDSTSPMASSSFETFLLRNRVPLTRLDAWKKNQKLNLNGIGDKVFLSPIDPIRKLLRASSVPAFQLNPDGTVFFKTQWEKNSDDNKSVKNKSVIKWRIGGADIKYEDYLNFKNLGSRAWGNVLDFTQQEVEPDTAAPTIIRISLKTPSEKVTAMVSAINKPLEKKRQKLCGNSVRELRRDIKLPGGYKNPLSDYIDVCLGSEQIWGKKVSLSSENYSKAKICLATYTHFFQKCYSSFNSVNPITTLMEKVVGILIVPANNETKRIVCSATMVGRFHIVTAKHCLSSISFNLQKVGAIKMWFMPYSESGLYAISAVRTFPNFLRIDVNDQSAISTALKGKVGEDLVFLETKEYIGSPTDGIIFPIFSTASSGDKVNFIAFQRLIARTIQLDTLIKEKIIPDDQMLLKLGTWKNAMAVDGTPTCVLLDFESNPKIKGVLGHMCQSLQGGSGGAMIIYEHSTKQIKIVGIHSRSAPQLETSDFILEKSQPKNLAVITNASFNNKVETFETARRTNQGN